MSEQAKLLICNLVSRGMSLADARAKVAGEVAEVEAKKEATEPEAPKKLTTAEKKAGIALAIEALGGQVPSAKSSLAKFTEALTAAKTAVADKEQAEADEAQAVADKEQAEADEAKKAIDLM
jgi:hypothetical protein